MSNETYKKPQRQAVHHQNILPSAKKAVVINLLDDDDDMKRGHLSPPRLNTENRLNAKPCVFDLAVVSENYSHKITKQMKRKRQLSSMQDTDLMVVELDGTPKTPKSMHTGRPVQYDDVVIVEQDRKLSPKLPQNPAPSTIYPLALNKQVPTSQSAASLPEITVYATKRTKESEVLEIFPDAEMAYVQLKLQHHNGEVAAVVADMIENKYKKSNNVPSSNNGLLNIESKQKWKYDYMNSQSFEPSQQYKSFACDLLQLDFCFLSKSAIRKVLARYNNHYAMAHDAVLTAIKGDKQSTEQSQFRNVSRAIQSGVLSDEQIKRVIAITNDPRSILKNPKRSGNVHITVTEEVLKEEMEYVKGKLKDWLSTMSHRTERERNKEIAQASHTAIECSCCFDDVAIENMVACREEGHLFCEECFQTCVETQVFGNGNFGIDETTKKAAIDMKCFHSSGCSSGFSRATLERALPTRTLEKYDELQSQLTLEASGLSDLCSCPKCAFQAILPSTQRIFSCPVADCRFESCRDCGEESHIPLKCSEVEKKSETQGRLTVEEAITAAKVRHCPKCKKAFLKDSGCNKITCACGSYVCYVCRQIIKNYTHFCQVPHCNHINCNQCPLHTNAEQDDERAMREAGLRAVEKIKESIQASGSNIEVNVDVEKILQQPPVHSKYARFVRHT